ncbi:hypothetical protein CAEBREN_02905 [Caenorhabditis brenneri]|uniref:Uncharacterized protein n=1 Tax=Caenorhabditis brenneri TaxID=135651 RepID=G0NZL7_CAEBE|nr:hypothetical protein CAEBREN_02905 [Caenorhabditis brenneri]
MFSFWWINSLQKTQLISARSSSSTNHSIAFARRIAAQYNFKALKDHCLNKLTCRAEIRAVLGMSATGLDPSICAALLEKSLSLQ